MGVRSQRQKALGVPKQVSVQYRYDMHSLSLQSYLQHVLQETFFTACRVTFQTWLVGIAACFAEFSTLHIVGDAHLGLWRLHTMHPASAKSKGSSSQRSIC